MSSELATMDKQVVEKPGEQTALPAQEPSVNAALKDILFGSTAGMIGKVFEYPFDTVKVRKLFLVLKPLCDHADSYSPGSATISRSYPATALQGPDRLSCTGVETRWTSRIV